MVFHNSALCSSEVISYQHSKGVQQSQNLYMYM